MPLSDVAPEKVASYRANYEAFETLSDRYRRDVAVRSRIDAGDVTEFVDELGIALPADYKARIVVNTPDTHYVVLPPDPNIVLADEELVMVAGGKTAGTAGTQGTAASLACSSVPSTASSASSAGTAGSAGG